MRTGKWKIFLPNLKNYAEIKAYLWPKCNGIAELAMELRIDGKKEISNQTLLP
jgi:hypothetical protein